MKASVNLSTNSSSSILFALMWFIHMGAIACVLCLNFSLSLKLVLVCVIVFNLIFILYPFRYKKSVVKIYQVVNAEWQLLTDNGELLPARLCSNSLITRYLIILNFSIPGKNRKKTLLLFPDMFDKQTFRRLRVQLLSSI